MLVTWYIYIQVIFSFTYGVVPFLCVLILQVHTDENTFNNILEST